MNRVLPSHPAAVLFDLDGTLVHTAPDLADALNRTLAELELPAQDEDVLAHWVGDGAAALVGRALASAAGGEPKGTLLEHALARFAVHYRAGLATRSQPYPQAPVALKALRAAGLKLGCVTNKSSAFTEPLLAALGLDACLDCVVAGDALPRKKPDPLPLIEACRRLVVEPTRAVMVGDSRNDVAAARAAGMPVICVTYGYNYGIDVRTLAPDAVIDCLDELPGLLRRASEAP